MIKSTVDEQTKKLQAGVRSSVDFAAKSKLFQFQPNTGTCSIFFVFCLYQQNLQPSASSSQVHELITLPQAPCFMFFCPALVGWTSYQPSGCSCLYMLFLSPAGWMDFLPALFVFIYIFFIGFLFRCCFYRPLVGSIFYHPSGFWAGGQKNIALCAVTFFREHLQDVATKSLYIYSCIFSFSLFFSNNWLKRSL